MWWVAAESERLQAQITVIEAQLDQAERLQAEIKRLEAELAEAEAKRPTKRR